jgi:hypothetical protein
MRVSAGPDRIGYLDLASAIACLVCAVGSDLAGRITWAAKAALAGPRLLVTSRLQADRVSYCRELPQMPVVVGWWPVGFRSAVAPWGGIATICDVVGTLRVLRGWPMSLWYGL